MADQRTTDLDPIATIPDSAVFDVVDTTNTTQDPAGSSFKITKANLLKEATAAILLNTAKVGITTSQAAAILLNTAKIGITTDQAAAILLNSAKVGITTEQAAAILLNTAKTGITTAQASAIVDNTAKVGITTTQAAAILLNTSKVGITTDQAAAILLNTAKVGITTDQAAAILLNTAKVGITATQTSTIAANSIDFKLSDSILRGTDMFTFAGKFINQANGVEGNAANFKSTDFILFTVANTLNVTNLSFVSGVTRQASFYSDRTAAGFISAYTADNNTTITLNSSNIPATTKYVRLTALNANVPAITFDNADSVLKTTANINSILADKENKTKFLINSNLFTITGRYVNSTTGAEAIDSGFKCTDFIDFDSSIKVSITGLARGGVFRQASFFSAKSSTSLISSYTTDENSTINLDSTNIPITTRYVRFNTTTVSIPTFAIGVQKYQSVTPLRVQTAALDTISATSGYSLFYGKAWFGSSYSNNNDFSQLVYAVTAGQTIRARGNCDTGNNPLVVFFSNASALASAFVANGTSAVINGIKFYNITEVVPAGATHCIVQQRRLLDISQPFTELVVSSEVDEVKSKVILIGDSFTQMAGYAEDLMNLVKIENSSYDVFNYGIGGEKTIEICSRVNAFQMFITPTSGFLTTDAQNGQKFFTLPATTATVEIGANSISNSYNSTKLLLLVQTTITKDCEPKTVIIDGVKCLLTLSGGSYFLNRVVSDTVSRKIYENAQMIPFTSLDIKETDVVILNIGQNGGFSSVDDLVLQYTRLVDSLGTKRYIVLSSHYSQINNAGGSNYQPNTIDLEIKLKKSFGAKYVNMREYFITRGVVDALESGFWNSGSYPTDIAGEVHPSSADTTAMTEGRYAPMFWPNPNNSADIIHLSKRSYYIYYRYIFNKMKFLKYFI